MVATTHYVRPCNACPGALAQSCLATRLPRAAKPVIADVTRGLLKIQQSCASGLRLDLGQRVQHSGRGYGKVCKVDHEADKCYHVVFDDGETHRYDPIQAGVKFTLVEGTRAVSGVRVTISASSLESTALLDGAFPYALVRRISDGAVVAKTEWVKPSRSPSWHALLVPYTDLGGDGRVRVEVHVANMSKADQLIGACELNLIAAVDLFDGVPLLAYPFPQKCGSLTLHIEDVHDCAMPAGVLDCAMPAATLKKLVEAGADATFEKLMHSRSPRQSLAVQQPGRRRSLPFAVQLHNRRRRSID